MPKVNTVEIIVSLVEMFFRCHPKSRKVKQKYFELLSGDVKTCNLDKIGLSAVQIHAKLARKTGRMTSRDGQNSTIFTW